MSKYYVKLKHGTAIEVTAYKSIDSIRESINNHATQTNHVIQFEDVLIPVSEIVFIKKIEKQERND